MKAQGPVETMLRAGRAEVVHRWGQAKSDAEVAGVCILTALYQQNRRLHGFYICREILTAALPEDFDRKQPMAVIRYNDTPGRTKEECLAVYDRAIALAKEKGL